MVRVFPNSNEEATYRENQSKKEKRKRRFSAPFLERCYCVGCPLLWGLFILTIVAGATLLILYLAGVFKSKSEQETSVSLTSTIKITTTSSTTTTTTTTTSPTTTKTTTTTSTTATTTTTSTTTTTVTKRTFNETCSDNCEASVGLACSPELGVCVCDASNNFWSYVSSSCIECKTGWVAYLDCCMKYVSTAAGFTFPQADSFCRSEGGLLLSAESVHKFNFMKSYYSNSHNNLYVRGAWLNSKAEIPKKYLWPNGEPVNAAFWAGGQPDNFLGTDTFISEGCLEIRQAFGAKLNDLLCAAENDVLCEYSS